MAGKLSGKVALVTGASRGIGRGIALQLGEAGAKVYITGRKPKQDTQNTPTPLEKTAQEITERGGHGVALYCDHSNAESVKDLFEQIKTNEEGQLDILVNNAFSAAETIFKTREKKFWELDPLIWDEVNNVGLRNHYICAVYAARLMIPRRKGLIVTVSSAGGLLYIFSVAYGAGKAGCDRLAADAAQELREMNIASVSLWPGSAKTEFIKENILNKDSPSEYREGFAKGETPEFAGLGIVHLATDPNIMELSGRILMTSDLGDKYGFTDIDGRRIESLRGLGHVLKRHKWDRLAGWVPGWLKLPGWMYTAGTSRL